MKAVLENLEGVSEEMASEYEEKDGKFFLKVEGIDSHPDVAGMKFSYEEVKNDRKSIKENLKKTAKELDDAKLALSEANLNLSKNSKNDKDAEAKFAEYKAEQQAVFDKRIAELADENKDLKTDLNGATIGTALTKAMQKAEIKPENQELLALYMTSHLARVDGEVVVVNGEGVARPGLKGNMTVGEFLNSDVKTKFPGSFPGNNASGGGVPPSENGKAISGSTIKRSEFDAMDSVAQAKLMVKEDGSPNTDVKIIDD